MSSKYGIGLPFFARHPVITMALVTPAVLLVHGYHPLADDGAVYVTGIKKLANPSLYQSDAVFASSPTHLSIFAHVLAPLLLHRGSLPALLLVCHLASIFLFLLGRMEGSRTNFLHAPRLLGSGVAGGMLLHSSGCGHVALHHGSLRHGSLIFHAAVSFRVGGRARREMGGVLPLAGCGRSAPPPDGWLHGNQHADRCAYQAKHVVDSGRGLRNGVAAGCSRLRRHASCGSQPCVQPRDP